MSDQPEIIKRVLAERGTTHGNFEENARVSQNIKRAMHDSPNWNVLPSIMKEALEVEALKVSRILSGNFLEYDHWLDKAGYVNLVLQYLDESK